MNFILAERYGYKILIAENISTNEYFVLDIAPYSWGASDSKPGFYRLNGMTVKIINDKEALSILEKYASDTVPGCKVKKFIERYIELPF